MVKKEDFHKAIIRPNEGAAGLKLGATTQTVSKVLGQPHTTEQIKADQERWGYGDVWVWFKADKVDQINVTGLHEGKTKEGIGIGSTRKEVEKVFGMLEWDGTWLINIPPFGIGFDFGSSIMGENRVTDIFIFPE